MSNSIEDAEPDHWSGHERTHLLGTGLLQNIAEDEVRALLPAFTRRELPAGRVLFTEGHRDDGAVYVVLEGRLALSRGGDSAGAILAVLGPGDLCGEVTALDPGPRASTGRALTPTVVARLGRDELVAWASTRPAVAEQMFRVLARRLRRTNDAVVDLVFVDVPGRVARHLLELERRFGEPRGSVVLVSHGLTQERLAALVGATRETVNKALRNFESRGWIELRSRGFILRDRVALARRASVGTSAERPTR